MNKIVYHGFNETTVYEGTVRQVTKKFGHGPIETAFIGKVGLNDQAQLYLITFDTIANAKHPDQTYSDSQSVFIQRFVDIEIRIKEK